MPPLPLAYDVLYWGIQTSTLLLGVTLLQGWTYFAHNRDGWKLRSFVAFLIFLDIACAFFVGDIGHHLFLAHFGEKIARLPISISTFLESVTSAIITISVQLLFAWRVYILYPDNKIAPSIIAALTLGSFVSFILFSVNTAQHPSISNFSTLSMRLEVGGFFGFSLITDIVTTFFLVKKFYASRMINNTGTKLVLHQLMKMIVSRGVLLSFALTAMLVVYLADPGGIYWTPMHLSISRLYVITLISMLNSRRDNPQGTTLVVSNPSYSGGATSVTFSSVGQMQSEKSMV